MIRKVSFLLLIICSFLSLFVSTSCKVERFKDLKTIEYSSILSQKGDYIVFIYGDNCYYCEQLKPIILEYANLANKKRKMMKIYGLNSSNTRDNEGLIPEIPEGCKDPDDLYDDFLNTTNYEDIHIVTTPALIVVEDGTVTKYISSKTTYYPKTNIQEYIASLMAEGEDNEK